MNKDSSIKQLKRIKQDMTHADDVNALNYAIRFMKNKTLEKIRAEIENHCGLTKENHCKYCSYCNSVMGVREILEIIDKYKEDKDGEG